MDRGGASLPEIGHETRHSALPCPVRIESNPGLAAASHGSPLGAPGSNARYAENKTVGPKGAVLGPTFQGVDRAFYVHDGSGRSHGGDELCTVGPGSPVARGKEVLRGTTVETPPLEGLQKAIRTEEGNQESIGGVKGRRTRREHTEICKRENFSAKAREDFRGQAQPGTIARKSAPPCPGGLIEERLA